MAAPLPEYEIPWLPLLWMTLCCTRPLMDLENLTPVTALWWTRQLSIITPVTEPPPTSWGPICIPLAVAPVTMSPLSV